MSDKELKELQKYNLEYLEARNSEEIFGGDYTSAVELKYANKEIKRLNNIIEEAKEYIESRARKAGVELMPREIELLEILNKGE